MTPGCTKRVSFDSGQVHHRSSSSPMRRTSAGARRRRRAVCAALVILLANVSVKAADGSSGASASMPGTRRRYHGRSLFPGQRSSWYLSRFSPGKEGRNCSGKNLRKLTKGLPSRRGATRSELLRRATQTRQIRCRESQLAGGMALRATHLRDHHGSLPERCKSKWKTAHFVRMRPARKRRSKNSLRIG